MLGNVYRLFLQANVNGAYDQAVDAYDQALVLSPNDPITLLDRARLESLSGDQDSAFEFITQSARLRATADTFLLAADVETLRNNDDQALVYLGQAVNLVHRMCSFGCDSGY